MDLGVLGTAVRHMCLKIDLIDLIELFDDKFIKILGCSRKMQASWRVNYLMGNGQWGMPH